jgi:hypothetical protein
VARLIEARPLSTVASPGEARECLIERVLECLGIDLGENLILRHAVVEVDIDRRDLAGDFGADLDLLARLHLARRGDDARDVALVDRYGLEDVLARRRAGSASEEDRACAYGHDGGPGDPNQNFLVHLSLSVRPLLELPGPDAAAVAFIREI